MKIVIKKFLSEAFDIVSILVQNNDSTGGTPHSQIDVSLRVRASASDVGICHIRRKVFGEIRNILVFKFSALVYSGLDIVPIIITVNKFHVFGPFQLSVYLIRNAKCRLLF